MDAPIIALDTMGSDRGPETAVAAAAELSLAGGIHIVLVGPADPLGAFLSEQRYDPAWVSIRHASQSIEMHEKPREAVESKSDASMVVAARMVAEGDADGMVTAGSTGAAILTASRELELLPGIHRAALAAVIPTQQRHGLKNDPFTLVLDVGATVKADAETLVQFAHMGEAYCRIISRTDRPTVALLSNGTEPTKGPPQVVEAHARLAALERTNFIGNIEGLDIPTGRANVVVCDGFVGNIALKMFEGMGDVLVQAARYAYRRKVTWKIGLMLLQSGIKQIREVTDWREYGGAPLLGFRQVVIKAHGRSGSRALANAVKVAAKARRDGLTDRIAEALTESR